MKIRLSVVQRLGLESILSAQRGNLDDLFLVRDILNKIRVPKDQRQDLVKTLPNGTVLVDEDAIVRTPAIEVEFEKEESRRVLKLLQTWDRFSADDLDWLIPLKKTLEAE